MVENYLAAQVIKGVSGREHTRGQVKRPRARVIEMGMEK